MALNCIDDDYEHIDSSLIYVMENVLSEAALNGKDNSSEALRKEYNSDLMNFCKCINLCDTCNCAHGNNYSKHSEGNKYELILKDDVKKDLIYECSRGCFCNDMCHNRLVQYGPRKYLKIVYSQLFKSLGVITSVSIPRGAFICEYAGELLTKTEALQRLKKNEELKKINYIIFLNEIQEGGENCLTTIVDPTEKGNIGRYLNHSCDPNCEIYSVRVDCPIPKICIFSLRDIKAEEELCFHYGGGHSSNKHSETSLVHCLCNSAICEKFLPNTHF